MKKMIFLEILHRIRAKPKLQKKVKVFAIIGVAGLLVTTAIAFWAGLTLVRYAGKQIQSADLQNPLQQLETRFESIPAITTLSCWDKAQSLMTVEAWLTRPLSDNFRNLKSACLESRSPVCKGEECQQIKMRMRTAESEQTI